MAPKGGGGGGKSSSGSSGSSGKSSSSGSSGYSSGKGSSYGGGGYSSGKGSSYGGSGKSKSSSWGKFGGGVGVGTLGTLGTLGVLGGLGSSGHHHGGSSSNIGSGSDSDSGRGGSSWKTALVVLGAFGGIFLIIATFWMCGCCINAAKLKKTRSKASKRSRANDLERSSAVETGVIDNSNDTGVSNRHSGVPEEGYVSVPDRAVTKACTTEEQEPPPYNGVYESPKYY